MSNLIKKVQNTCFQNDLFKKGDRILLAVSGGPDSVALLNIFLSLQKKYSLELAIAHVNYNLRGADSQKDAELVKKLAEKNGLKIFIKSVRAAKKNISENYLRNLRYDFFEKIRNKNNFNFIAVGHNADDQVETFLMRIVRGSGLSGLSAMKFKNNFIIRPLLTTSRREIIKYLKENKKTYRIDKTNKQNLFLRNKIRNKLIPQLEKDFNLNIRETILNSLYSISEDANFLENATEKYSRKIDVLKIKDLKKLHPAILRRVLRNKLEIKKGDLKNISMRNIEEIIKIIKSTKSKNQIVILPGLKITRKNDRLSIIKIN